MQENSIDEVTDVFLDFGGQKLVESTSTQSVNEHVHQFLVILGQSESEMNVNVDEGIIFGWTFLNWGIIVNDVLRKEADNSPVTEVEPVGTWIHKGLGGATVLLEDREISGNILLDVAANAAVVPPNHGQNALVVVAWVLVVSIHDFGSLGQVVGVALCDSGPGVHSLLILQHF